MIITRTPFRISFFGGGTDYPQWFKEHGGSVLATTIDKYCYISCRFLPPFFDYKHRIVYAKIENVNNIDEIKHPSVRSVLKWSKVNKGVESHHDGALPSRSGLGSSSSFTVGLIKAVSALNGKMTNKECLAKDAIHIEQDIIHENVGSQDQISAAYGGFNRITFQPNGAFDVDPVIISNNRRRELHSHLMLFFTGFSRIASEIAESQIKNLHNRKTELMRMREMVDEAIDLLRDQKQPIEKFGTLLHESWQNKRKLSNKVSSAGIDSIYEAAIDSGAIGGKILGAGGGGFMLIFAKPEKHRIIKDRLNELVHVPFNFDDSGSRITMYQPNEM